MKCLGMLYWEDLSAGFGTMRPREPIKLFIYIFFLSHRFCYCSSGCVLNMFFSLSTLGSA